MSDAGLSSADLSSVATSTLERLREAIATNVLKVPVTRSALLAHGVRNQLEALEGALSGHTRLACLSVLDVSLGERRSHARVPPELVWSGPERTNATARDSAVVLRALFEGAKSQVILAGYDFRRGSSLLEPLSRAMKEREIDVRFFVHIEQPDSVVSDPRAHADEKVRALMSAMWPFDGPRPHVYYDARALEPRPRVNMHAKCVVVDGERALVTSANFTSQAHELNTECGVYLEDAVFARHLARQWLGLVECGLVVEARGV